MIAQLVIALSIVGLASSVAERHVSDRRKSGMEAIRQKSIAWMEKARKINFAQRIRQRRVVLAMALLPLIFVGSILWLFPKAIVATLALFLGLAALCVPLLWWLSRSRDDRTFVLRYALIVLAAFLAYQATMYRLVTDLEGVDEFLIFGPAIIAFKIFFLLVFGFVFFFAFLPFIAAQLASWLLRTLDLYVHYCLGNYRRRYQ